ncbi:MAG: hypothetical protein J1D77_07945 [Muribaculaceae bacterium]|nr:hypothetical protein [Muribaculaceae bacterium]
MNRKLLNGFLLVAFAAGGVATFTSCKDEDFRTNVDYELDALQAQINAIRGVEDDAFKQNLQNWLDALTEGASDPYNWTYEEMVAAVAALQWTYDNVVDGNYDEVKEFVDGLYKMMFENIFPEEDWFQTIWKNQNMLENLSKRPSSVGISQTFNPMFGTINLPVGLKSTVLAGYVYKSNTSVSFPGIMYGNLASAVQAYISETEFNNTVGAIKAIYPNSLDLAAGEYAFSDTEDFGNLGGAILTINPANLDLESDDYTLELVNSAGDVVLTNEGDSKGLEIAPYDGDILTFGATRADESNNLYKLCANAEDDTFSGLLIDFDDEKSEVKAAFKQLIQNKDLSNIAHFGEVLLDAINDKVPAYAVKISWDEEEYASYDAEGNGVGTPTTITNYVTTDYDLAAVVAHPLSYGTNIGSQIPSGKKLPMISPLTEYLDRISNKLNISFDEVEGVDPVVIYIEVIEVPADAEEHANELMLVFHENDENGEVIGEPVYYDPAQGNIAMDQAALEELANALVGGYNNQVVNSDIVKSINDAIDSVNDALSDVEGQVGDFQDYLKKAQDSKLLTYGQKLVDLYNQVAEKVNNFLADPNHYLQVMAVYSAADGAHHLSTLYGDPVHFDSSKGDGFTIYASSYNGDVIVPSYKKYVAITAVDGVALTAANSDNYNGGENAEFLNTLLNGQVNRIPFYISDDMVGHTLTITYLSVDYRGKCSMQNYYVHID